MAQFHVTHGALNGGQVRVYMDSVEVDVVDAGRVEQVLVRAGQVKDLAVKVQVNTLPGPAIVEVLVNGSPVKSVPVPPGVPGLVGFDLTTTPVAAGDRLAFRAASPMVGGLLRFTALVLYVPT